MLRSEYLEQYTMNWRSLPMIAIIPLSLVVVLLLITPTPAQAQADSDAPPTREYVGSQECAACHRDLVNQHATSFHAQALTDTTSDKTSIIGDFTTGDAVRTIIFPGETEARALTIDDISFAIGSGKYVQRYLYEAEANRYIVLPIEWNALEQVWQPFTLADSWPAPAYDWTTQCAACHTTNFSIAEGIWAEDGVQCEACHGPGSLHLDAGEATDPILTKRERTVLEGSIERGLDPAICGQCHSQGTEPAHGYPFPIDYQPGDPLLNQNTFRLVSDRSVIHWWSTGQAAQPNMQFNEWGTSVHAEAFLTVAQHPKFTPGCLTCHNSTFARASEIVTEIELSDDRERLDILFDEADLDVDNIYNVDWETLKTLTLNELTLDQSEIDNDLAFLPQILPLLIERMYVEDELVDGQILPRELAEVLRIADEGSNDDHINRAFGVTCATCHSQHANDEAPMLANDDSESSCTTCHRSAEPIYGIHHPVREVFEGQPLVQTVVGIPGSHFSAENGPTCATCHMPTILVENASRVSHTLDPILPAAAIDGITDSCVGCHGDTIEGQAMQDLIDSIQNATRARYDTVKTALTDGSPSWLSDILAIIEGDGSWGLHNYAYTSALLSQAERELGLVEGIAEIVLPDIPVQEQPQVSEPQQTEVTTSGLTLPSIIFLAIAVGMILISAYLFLIRGREQ